MEADKDSSRQPFPESVSEPASEPASKPPAESASESVAPEVASRIQGVETPSKRDIVESWLIEQYPGKIRPLNSKEGEIVHAYADGGFAGSCIGYSLYSNGFNPRGTSTRYPYGLIFEDGDTIFSLGYFRKEGDPPDDDGYLFIVSPRSRQSIFPEQDHLKHVNAVDTAGTLARFVLQTKDQGRQQVPCKGVYMRFLTLNQYEHLITTKNRGWNFHPAKEHPWHPDAPEEDETLCNSVISLEETLGLVIQNRDIENYSGKDPWHYVIDKSKSTPPELLQTAEYLKNGLNRGFNFLRRNNLRVNTFRYHSAEYESHLEVAKEIVDSHFSFLRKTREVIGSRAEDYYGVISREWFSYYGEGYCGQGFKSDKQPTMSERIKNRSYCPHVAGFFSVLSSRGKFANNPSEEPVGWKPEPVRLDVPESDIRYLHVPISLYIGELVSPSRFALYCTIALRSAEDVLPRLGLDPTDEEVVRGFSALPLGELWSAVWRIREEKGTHHGLQKNELKEVLLGGSETPGLNQLKRRLGARNDPTYWAVMLRKDVWH